MLLTVALLAQTATLPTDNREAALTCAAVIRAGTAVPSNDLTVAGTWFMMTAARNATGGNLLERTLALRDTVEARTEAVKGQRSTLLGLCRQRFPNAWKSVGIALPADSYRRLLMCFSASTFLDGLYQGGQNPADKQRTERLSAQFETLTSPELDKRGVATTEAVVDLMVGSLGDTLDLGNIAGVVNACEAAFPR